MCVVQLNFLKMILKFKPIDFNKRVGPSPTIRRPCCNLDNFNLKSIGKKNSIPLRVTNIYVLTFTNQQTDIYLRTMYN